MRDSQIIEVIENALENADPEQRKRIEAWAKQRFASSAHEIFRPVQPPKEPFIPHIPIPDPPPETFEEQLRKLIKRREWEQPQPMWSEYPPGWPGIADRPVRYRPNTEPAFRDFSPRITMTVPYVGGLGDYHLD